MFHFRRATASNSLSAVTDTVCSMPSMSVTETRQERVGTQDCNGNIRLVFSQHCWSYFEILRVWVLSKKGQVRYSTLNWLPASKIF